MSGFNQREYQRAISGIDYQAEASEVFVKGKAGHTVKETGYDDIRNSVTEGKAFVPGKFSVNLLRLQPDRVVASNNEQFRPDYINKLDRKVIAGAIPEQGDSFADNIPCSIKGNFVLSAIFKQFYCPIMVGVIGE